MPLKHYRDLSGASLNQSHSCILDNMQFKVGLGNDDLIEVIWHHKQRF
jgi:hypothetical protein